MKQALPYGIINVILSVLIAFDIWFFNANAAAEEAGIIQYILLAVIFMVFIVFSFMKYYIPMMIITFKLSLKQVFKNSLIFAFAGLKRNLLISWCLSSAMPWVSF